MNLCFLDIETTGTDPLHHGICQIGALVNFDKPLVIDGVPIHTHKFHADIRVPKRKWIDHEALKVNGETIESIYSEKRLELYIALRALTEKVLHVDLVDRWVLVGHNPGFDVGFLKQAFRECEIEYPFSYRSIDTHTMFVDRFGYSTGMDGARERVGLPREEKPHIAVTGAFCAMELYTKLKTIPCIQQ